MRRLLVFAILILAVPARAQELDRNATPFKAVGTVVTTSPIRDAPPHGFLNIFLGDEIHSTTQGAEVSIIGKKAYGGFRGSHVWYLVDKVGDQTVEQQRAWWVYGGVEGQRQQIRIERILEEGEEE